MLSQRADSLETPPRVSRRLDARGTRSRDRLDSRKRSREGRTLCRSNCRWRLGRDGRCGCCVQIPLALEGGSRRRLRWRDCRVCDRSPDRRGQSPYSHHTGTDLWARGYWRAFGCWSRARLATRFLSGAAQHAPEADGFGDLMHRRALIVLTLVLPSVLAGQSPPTPELPNAVMLQFIRFADIFGSRLVAAFDSIPAARYDSRPTPSQQTIGYIAQHLEDANYSLCERLGVLKHPRTPKDSLSDTVKAQWPKDTLVARLEASLRFCDTAMERLGNSSRPRLRAPCSRSRPICQSTTVRSRATCDYSAWCLLRRCRRGRAWRSSYRHRRCHHTSASTSSRQAWSSTSRCSTGRSISGRA